jgi:anti-sigma B factor antagonist
MAFPSGLSWSPIGNTLYLTCAYRNLLEQKMQLETELCDGALIVHVPNDRIDAAGAIEFKDGMVQACKDGPVRIVLDLGNVGFLDSSGLGAVVAVMKLLGADRKLELASLSPNVAKVFRLTRMDSVFTIHETVGAAFPPAEQAS